MILVLILIMIGYVIVSGIALILYDISGYMILVLMYDMISAGT